MATATQSKPPDIFAAIAHADRRQILDMLIGGEATVTQIAAAFDSTRPAISQHLRLLLDMGLVTKDVRGREHYYQLQPGNLLEVFSWVRKYEIFWAEKLDALETYLDDHAEDD